MTSDKIHVNAKAVGNAIRNVKPNAADLFRELIGIVFNNLEGGVSPFLEDF